MTEPTTLNRCPNSWGHYTDQQLLCLVALGEIEFLFRNNEQAQALYEQALPMLEDARLLEMRIHTVKNLYLLALYCFDLEKMKAHYTQYLEITQDFTDAETQAMMLKMIGDVAFNAHNFVEAKQYLAQALPLIKQLGNAKRHAECVYCLAHCEEKIGRKPTARKLYREAYDLYTPLLDPIRMSIAYRGFARLCKNEEVKQRYLNHIKRLWIAIKCPDLMEKYLGIPATAEEWAIMK